MVSEEEYLRHAQAELKKLLVAFDVLEDDALEVELQNDILTLEFSDGSKYVVNSHRAAKQIWMAAERQAWHFDWSEAEQAFLCSKTQVELWAVLQKVVEAKLTRPFQLRKSAAH